MFYRPRAGGGASLPHSAAAVAEKRGVVQTAVTNAQ